MVTEVLNIITDPGFDRTTDTDMAPGGNINPDLTMASANSDQYVPKWHHSPQMSTWFSVAVYSTDIHMDLGGHLGHRH